MVNGDGSGELVMSSAADAAAAALEAGVDTRGGVGVATVRAAADVLGRRRVN